MKVRITKIHPDAVLPEYKTPGACCFDLVCIQDDVVPPKTIMKLPTGLVVCVPEGYMLMVASRSSTPKRGLQIIQGVGILDQDYCGPNDELQLMIYNYTDQPVQVKKGDRVYQAGFVRIDHAEWDEGPTMTKESRGGWGSTGK